MSSPAFRRLLGALQDPTGAKGKHPKGLKKKPLPRPQPEEEACGSDHLRSFRRDSVGQRVSLRLSLGLV